MRALLTVVFAYVQPWQLIQDNRAQNPSNSLECLSIPRAQKMDPVQYNILPTLISVLLKTTSQGSFFFYEVVS